MCVSMPVNMPMVCDVCMVCVYGVCVWCVWYGMFVVRCVCDVLCVCVVGLWHVFEYVCV